MFFLKVFFFSGKPILDEGKEFRVLDNVYLLLDFDIVY